MSQLSRTKVECAECGETKANWRNLGTHFKSFHPDKPVRAKGQTFLNFGQGASNRKRTRDEISHPVSSSSAIITVSPPGVSTTISDSFVVSSSPSIATSPRPSVSTSPTNTSVSPLDVSIMPPRSTSPPGVSTSPLDTPGAGCPGETCVQNQQLQQSSTNESSQIQCIEQIQELLDKMKLASFPNMTSQTSQNETRVGDIDTNDPVDPSKVIIERIQVCRCLTDLDKFLSDDFQIDRSNEQMICRLCVQNPNNATEHSPGIFKIVGVENEQCSVMSDPLRKLKYRLIKHLKTDIHVGKLEKQLQHEQQNRSRSQRNKEIGEKIGSLAYFFFYHKMPFLQFENFLAYYSLHQIDIGQINHSEHFLRRLIDPCHRELLKRLRTYLNKPLPCTDAPGPITLLADKGTIKHDTSQVTLIKTPCLNNGCLFQRFFVGNPIVTDSSGLGLTKLLLSTVCESLDWTKDEVRERYSGACYDGQYIHLNLRTHQAETLSLPESLMDESVTHDAAHRLELACSDVMDGKKKRDGTVILPPTKWLQELIKVLQHIMKTFRLGSNHADLHKIAKEMDMTFLEFNLFSDTRFVEHSHRTYDHFARMFPILFVKIQRDEQNPSKDEAHQSESIRLENLLVQLDLVVNLLFMKDLSHLLTYSSKEFQRFDVLPHYTMDVYYTLKKQLHAARNSFKANKIPEPIHLHKSENAQSYSVWKEFGDSIDSILNTLSYENVRLLCPAERGRVTRSGTMFSYDREGFKSIIFSRYAKYQSYLDTLIKRLELRFEPWPAWVGLCKNAFDFTYDLSREDRKDSFSQLLYLPHGIHPLVDSEKERLKAEYVTLLLNAESVMQRFDGDNVKYTDKDIWYELLTEEKFYRNCKYVNHFSLKFLNRSFNECIVESEVSSIESIQTKGRPLKQENVDKLNFISTNGPHPLMAMSLVTDFMTNHFGSNWHFTLNESKWFVSKTIDRKFEEARKKNNSLA